MVKGNSGESALPGAGRSVNVKPMDARPIDPETPDAILDAIRDHPGWPDARRDEGFDRLIARFPAATLAAAARRRLGDLGGADGGIVLRLVEALATPELLESLADALIGGPELPLERAYEALDLLGGAGLLDAYPELAERWAELDEAIDEAGSLDDLAAHLEEDPGGSWVALQGLAAVEPEVRAEIVAGLARGPSGPGRVAFVRLLAFAHDPLTRSAALRVLEAWDPAEPAVRAAWASIAADHPEPDVAASARRLAGAGAGAGGGGLPARVEPRIVDGAVTALDGRGRGTIALVAEDRGGAVACAYLCDAALGIREVVGHEGPADGFLAEFLEHPDHGALPGVPGLALGLLAGSLLLCGPEAPPALRYWLERTAGPGFRPRPFAGPFGDGDPAAVPPAEWPARAGAVLDACPSWLDDSDLTYELAEEIELREGTAPADPRRDAGAYRFLFEHRLEGRLEPYRRMLLWMAAFWHAGAEPGLGLSALALARQLSDPQHAVPGHPFIVALTTRSLDAARADLRRGVDLRDPAARARQAAGGPA